jgi:hypothetical protein
MKLLFFKVAAIAAGVVFALGGLRTNSGATFRDGVLVSTMVY